MRIDVWSDVLCPWCWLGNARLDKALAAFPHSAEVELVFRSFELDPRSAKDLDIPTNDMLATKYGFGAAQIDAMHERLHGLGMEDGIDFRFERARTSNSFDAHQLIHLASEQGKQRAMAHRLFLAQFHEGVRIGDRSALVRLATEVGLDAAAVESALDEQRLAHAVRADEAQARELGISGVPFFLVDGALAVSGAQSVEVLGELLTEGWTKQAS
jgi:predicted DsbA family dithiol-disulfide isomerase